MENNELDKSAPAYRAEAHEERAQALLRKLEDVLFEGMKLSQERVTALLHGRHLLVEDLRELLDTAHRRGRVEGARQVRVMLEEALARMGLS